MNSYKTAVAIAIGTLFAGAAFAQSNYSIEQRDRIEQARIDRGVQSGQLTSREADRLQGERAQIERMERRARSDGVMTANERAHITGAQDHLSRDIYREAHDRQVAQPFTGNRANYSIEERDRNEQARIDRGVQSGQLTSREADRLQGQRAQIERMESRARSDGTLTRNERARIDSAQDRLGRDIYRQSHDRQTANASGHRPNGWDRGNGNGWGRGNDNGRGNDFGRGHDNRRGNDFGRGHGNEQGHAFNREGTRGERNDAHAGTRTPRTDTTTPRTGGDTRADRSDRGAGRQASMPQAQARSTQSTPRATGQVAAARQGGDSGRRTR